VNETYRERRWNERHADKRSELACHTHVHLISLLVSARVRPLYRRLGSLLVWRSKRLPRCDGITWRIYSTLRDGGWIWLAAPQRPKSPSCVKCVTRTGIQNGAFLLPRLVSFAPYVSCSSPRRSAQRSGLAWSIARG